MEVPLFNHILQDQRRKCQCWHEYSRGLQTADTRYYDGYRIEDIFSCDEAGLIYRALPDKTLNTKDISCKGGKSAKERLTVMFTCSATGGKLKPLVIGKANQPRCFKNIKKENLPVSYESNKKAWMTSEIFNTWIREINATMHKKNATSCCSLTMPHLSSSSSQPTQHPFCNIWTKASYGHSRQDTENSWSSLSARSSSQYQSPSCAKKFPSWMPSLFD